ncbi:MAG: dicarboxylate/amino acid:cation symporter [Acidobacteria bacterium]|nr:dicarboxylate/amino acid:cation symporter [Acidobacteriota bacterium]
MDHSFEDQVASDLDEKTDDLAAAGRRTPLHARILIGLGTGVLAGGSLRALLGSGSRLLDGIVNYVTDPLGQLFLRLLLMIVVPLVFSALVVGVAAIGDVRKLGRVGLRTFAYTLILSAISVLIGLTLANTLRPGMHVDGTTRDELMARYATTAQASLSGSAARANLPDTPLGAVIKTLVPTNPVESAARSTPDMLGLMFFALLLGLAVTLLREEHSRPLISFFTGFYEAVAKLIELIMKFAPVAVACLLFTLTARFGFGFLVSLGWFVFTVLLGLSLHMFLVYSLSVKFLSRIPPLEFFRRIKTVMITAFSTSSSNATLPTALRVSEQNLGVPRGINSFVLTIGATANQNGTALYEGVTVLFLAQLAGVELTFAQQLMVVYLAILGGVGTAGVPSGSIPFIIVVLTTVGVNPALIAVILGIDRLLDMCRTTLNVVGDLTAATYIAKSEGAPLLPPLAGQPT